MDCGVSGGLGFLFLRLFIWLWVEFPLRRMFFALSLPSVAVFVH